jgi:LmbE family N-acetylglucosaminyl deacetylase
MTLVAFIAHPDDEVLHMGGTLARAAAEGHRTVLVTATDGLMGERPGGSEPPRLTQLQASAAVLGVQRVEHLGYADSGHGKDLYPDPTDRMRFVRASTAEAAGRLAEILRAEQPEILLVHDANGGYGHRDHIKAHQVGVLAAALAGVPRVLEATVPVVYRSRAVITHAIDVRRFTGQKRAALAAHESALSGSGRSAKFFRLLLRLPAPVLGREWFAELGPQAK